MSLTPAAWRAILAQESGDPFLWLVEITHPKLADPLRLTSNVEPIHSRGRLFHPGRMAARLFDQLEDRAPRASLTLEDVTHDLRADLLELSPTNAPRVSAEIVLGSDPNVTQRAFRNARLVQASLDLVAVEGELAGPSALSRAVPWQRFTPDIAPGVFRYTNAGR
ncbi:MAG: hypothetical protein DCC71_02915 [Proteobacteria bacterium]|nr:MAG: hypothetical protein DCC71_02915 [Pseudomonadota bacterium]